MEEATAPRKRPWFQLHLSTCVVLMVVAGAFIGLNALDLSFSRRTMDLNNKGKSSPELIYVEHCQFGWPHVYRRYYRVEGRIDQPWTATGATDVYAIATNAACGLITLAFIGLAFESFLRNLARTRAAQEPAP